MNPYNIRSLGALISEVNGLSAKNSDLSPVTGYKTGVKNNKKFATKETIFAVSRKIPFTKDNTKDNPRVSKTIGITDSGKIMIMILGVILNRKKKIAIKTNLIKNSNNACAMEAKTSDSLGKLILAIIPPAVTRLLVPETMPVAKTCQTVRPINANNGYGTDVSPMFKIPDRFKIMKEPIAMKGRSTAQTYPRNDCLYFAEISRMKSRQVSSRHSKVS